MLNHNRWFTRRNILLALLAFQLICLLAWVQVLTTVELAFVIPEHERSHWERVIQSFEREHPNIRIQLDSDSRYNTTDERAAIYKNEFKHDQAQNDLVYMDMTWTPEFADDLMDLWQLVDADKVPRNEFQAGFLSGEIEAGEYRGGLYRLPMRADIGLLFYRKDLLEQIGKSLPETAEDFRESVQALKTIKGPDRVGYLWQGKDDEGLITNFVEVLDTVGGTWIDQEANTPRLDSDEAIEAARILQELIQKDTSPNRVTRYAEEDALEEFLEENTLFLRGWPAFYENMRQKGWDETRIAIAPSFIFNDAIGRGCRGGWGFGIPKNAAHPKEAWEAIKYFTSEEAQREFVSESGYLPSRTVLFSEPDIVNRYPEMPQILEYLEADNISISRPALEQYTEASEILQEALSQILQGADVANTMKIAQTETIDLLNAQ